MDFERMPKIPRYGSSRDIMVITEKIDGTNAQIMIDEDLNFTACSKKRMLTLDSDNYGFCRWVHEHASEIVPALGPGRHYGEWWGSGIQRAYGLTHGDKRFSIFNTRRPADSLPALIGQVPILYMGQYDTAMIHRVFDALLDGGSKLRSDEYYKPEGIVVCHIATGQLMKMTYDYPKGKWGKK